MSEVKISYKEAEIVETVREGYGVSKYTHIPLSETETRTRVYEAVAFVVSTHYVFITTEINSGVFSGEIGLLEIRQLLN